MSLPPEPTTAALLAAEPPSDDRALAARVAPRLMFDAHEPFQPSVAGYTVFRASGSSPSFPREIRLGSDHPARPRLAIEYAIWWDWDISHLYELEHAWVYLDDAGQVVEAEASWHGGYHAMRTGGAIPFTEGRVRLLSEPGKHAMAPDESWFEARRSETLDDCARPGRGGVWITPLFEAHIHDKSPAADRAVQAHLAQYAFEPAYRFTRAFQIDEQHLVAWPRLAAWIPRRVGWWVRHLTSGT